MAKHDSGKQHKKTFFENGRLHLSMRQLAVFFFFSVFFLPDFFGIRIGVVLNGQRIAVSLALLWILCRQKRRNEMARLVFGNRDIWFWVMYLAVCFYTMVFRADIGSFMNPLLDLMALYFLTIYFLRYEYSPEELLRLIEICTWALSILGLFEALTHINLFSYLITVKGLGGGGNFREGVYRIGGNGAHPLGYGLYLLLLFPLSCYDRRTGKLNIMRNLVLTMLIGINAYTTGSRSTLGLILVEAVLLVVISGWENAKKALVVLTPLCGIVGLLLLLFSETDTVQTLFVRILTTVDGAVGTNLAGELLNYSSLYLDGSTKYRQALPEVFLLEWLSPLVGKGTNYSFSSLVDGQVVVSIDNYYVMTYIYYAYPGLITFILLCLSQIRYAVKGVFTKKNELSKALLIGFAAYFVNLWYVDSLGTLNYVFVLFGLLYYEIQSSAAGRSSADNRK